MKKNIQFLIWLVFMASYSAFGLIKDQLSNEISSNYNSTGIIIQRNYDSDLTEDNSIIKTYGYIDSHPLEALVQKLEINSFFDISYANVNMLFALIPKKNDFTTTEIEKLSENLSTNKILRMSLYLNNNYLSPIKKESFNFIQNQAAITKESQLFLQRFNNYLNQQKLNNIFSKEKTLNISKSIVGTYGLFMPKDFDMLNKFNGIGRTLSSAVSILDDFLLTANDFNSFEENITKEQFSKLQFLIFEAAMQAKAILFIPECISTKDSKDMRLPLALINNVNLDESTGEITLNLLFCKQGINDFHGFNDFTNAKKSLLGINNSVVEWEFIDYALILAGNVENVETNEPCSSSSLDPIHYKFSSAQIVFNGCINNQCYAQYENIDENIEQLQQNQLAEDDNIEFPCEHYNKKCEVKFDCGCDKYWPCHRCHNASTQRVCNNDKLKPRNMTTTLRCLSCNTEQYFSQHCISCGIQFADYFCGQCNHLTGMQDEPYHCVKCGICRIHGDRSFHCDVCGVCLDNQLFNNHKCRAGSAHDNCCICLEDAFTGCQILPCSHKIHKKCADQMIRHGIKNCPICKESFAHKLEKKPSSKKH